MSTGRLLKEPYLTIIIVLAIIALVIIVKVNKTFGAQTNQQVLSWVVKEFDKNYSISIHPVSMPKVGYVSRKKFKEIFFKASEKDYTERWVPKLGKERADWIREYHANSAVGLYLPKSMKDPEEIYVLNTLSPCEQEAFLAHELTHHLQEVVYGAVDLDLADADRQSATRELESRRFENRYRYEFCH